MRVRVGPSLLVEQVEELIVQPELARAVQRRAVDQPAVVRLHLRCLAKLVVQYLHWGQAQGEGLAWA